MNFAFYCGTEKIFGHDTWMNVSC